MPAPLTYASAFAYLVGLGVRFSLIGRAELSLTGEASATAEYPLLLIEGDAAGSEIIGEGQRPTGLDSFTIAVQVLDKRDNPSADELLSMLAETNQWADSLCEQLRAERPGKLAGVNKLSLPGQAGSVLACGWRVELTLKLAKDIDRTANQNLFIPE